MSREPHDAIPEAWLETLDAAIAHRGPDGCGRFRDRAVRPDGSVVDVVLVHRRLSVIDPAGGAQPMVSRATKDGEGTVAVVFNGCIYNHRELRAELERVGRRFTTDHSDTEVLIHGWRQWGDELWEKLDGMFAVGVWDAVAADMMIARDAIGEKPLYQTMWREQDGSEVYAFANNAAAVVKFSTFRPDRQRPSVLTPVSSHQGSFPSWLRYGHTAGFPEVSIDEPEPGLAKRLDDSDTTGWDTCFALDQRGVVTLTREGYKIDRTRGLWLAEVTTLLEQAVESRLEADVPLGCFLSGGVDSSVIAAIAKKKLGTLKTFTVRMPDPAYDESKYAEAVAKVIGTEHHTLDCDANPAEDLQMLIEQLGLPFGDSSILPTYWVSKAAREHVTVALSGDGGDELFVGYQRYKAAAYLKKYGDVLRRFPERLLGSRRVPRSLLGNVSRLIEAARYRGYQDLTSIFPTPMLHKLTSLPTFMRDMENEHSTITGMQAARISDIYFYLPFDLLRKTDTASMAVGLEVRAPMLHLPLVERCLKAPLMDLMPGGRLKGLLKDVAAQYVPRELIERPKMGFAIPIGEWFRTDYGGMRTMLLDHLESGSSTEPFGPEWLGISGGGGGINMPYVRQLIREHGVPQTASQTRGTYVVRDHSQRLYMLLVLSIWAKWLGRVGSGRQ